MLTELCAEIRNYFLRDPRKDIHTGNFVISNGSIGPLPFLQDGQYYRIVGSVFNDGVWKYGESDSGMHAETFSGAVWAMAVPPAVVALSQEIDAWVANNKTVLDSPFQSESFGGYSYSKSSSGSGAIGTGAAGTGAYGWQVQFSNRLNPYRRVSVL